MEKVFQIHLAGLLFTIEEEAYHQLKSYLDKLHTHFSNNADIVQDIESRMAELLQRRLDASKITIQKKDVLEVIEILGHINQMDEHGEPQTSSEPKPSYQKPTHHRLRRNPDDQNLGGVCSGIASFFDVDPVLIRVIFVLLLVAYGSGILFYLILWVVLPEAKGDDLVYMREQKVNKLKKLFRDSENRVIGGVSAGLAAYFGLDRAWIRLAFVISVFLFGTGFWVYIVLWIIVPKAITASEKLLMRGESIDINSIKNEFLNSSAGNKMNSIAQHGSSIISKIVSGFFKFVAGIAALVLFTAVIGISIAMVAVFLNLNQTHFLNDLIAFTIHQPETIWAAKIGVLLVLLAPLLALLVAVIRVLFHLPLLNKTWFLSLGGLFVIGVVSLAYAGINFGNQIKYTESRQQIIKTSSYDTLYFNGQEMPYDEIDNESNEAGEMAFRDKGILMGTKAFFLEIDQINFKQSKTDSIAIKIVKRANGKNKQDARENIEMIQYAPTINLNQITLPSYFSLAKDQKFSWQEVEITVWVPENKIMIINPSVREYMNEEKLEEADGTMYQFQKGKLVCIDCAVDETEIWEENEIDTNINLSIKINKEGVKIDM
ncbi:MAG: PspC domain-containing protein [Bacteroidia bacterium]|nr:PspC domain-containing protein [Bacteroidia bacterium]